ncbi:MAG: CsbD family protein [Planctomycetes bacterium]|nr:CsbD family protein [Planctomycetota bacterium]
MNKDELKGKWTQIKGQLKSRWGRLTDDDLGRIEGRREELAGLLQQRYGLLKEQADKDCKAFFDSCGSKAAPDAHAEKTTHVVGKPAATGQSPLVAPATKPEIGEKTSYVVHATDADAKPKSP